MQDNNYPLIINLWNSLPVHVVHASAENDFKNMDSRLLVYARNDV